MLENVFRFLSKFPEIAISNLRSAVNDRGSKFYIHRITLHAQICKAEACGFPAAPGTYVARDLDPEVVLGCPRAPKPTRRLQWTGTVRIV